MSTEFISWACTEKFIDCPGPYINAVSECVAVVCLTSRFLLLLAYLFGGRGEVRLGVCLPVFEFLCGHLCVLSMCTHASVYIVWLLLEMLGHIRGKKFKLSHSLCVSCDLGVTYITFYSNITDFVFIYYIYGVNKRKFQSWIQQCKTISLSHV